MKGKLRIALLLVGALAGGHLVDKNMKSRIPLFTIVLPLAAGGILWRINSEMKGEED